MQSGKYVALLIGVLISVISVTMSGTTLTVWGGWPLLKPIFEQIKSDYERLHPNASVEIVLMDIREFERKLAVSLPAGMGPDIFITSEYIVPQYVAAGLVAKPPDHVRAFIEESFDALVKRCNRFVGPGDTEPQFYGVPHIGIARVLFWNRAMFAEAGLPDRPPETWDELVKFSRKLTVYDDKGNVVRSGISWRLFGGGSGITEKWAIVLAQAGTTVLGTTPDGKWRAAYDNEAGREAIQLYVDSVHKYRVDSFEAPHDAAAFMAGQTAMFYRELWPIPSILKLAPDLDFGTALMPKFKERGTVYSTESYFVSAHSRNKELAWDFILFASQPEYAKRFLRECGWIPPRIDIDFSDIFAEIPQYKAAIVADYPAGYRLALYPPIVPVDEIYTRLSERLERAFRDPSLVDNQAAIDQLLHEAAAETNAILAEWGLLGEGPVTPYWITVGEE